MKAKFNMFLFVSAALLIAACSKYPPSSDRLLEDLAIVTQYDVKFITKDFSMYKTYSLPANIVKVTDKDTTVVTGVNATTILNEIAKNMNERGFVLATGDVKPDLGISVVYFQNTNVYAYYPDYYYWGYPYYGWGYYYPYYPVYYSSYTTGLADIEMIDLKNPGPNNTLYIRWSAFIRGLLTDTHTVGDITNAVDQAFIQTPQLVTTAN